MNRRRFFTFLPGALAAAAVPVVAKPVVKATPLRYPGPLASLEIWPEGVINTSWHPGYGDMCEELRTYATDLRKDWSL